MMPHSNPSIKKQVYDRISYLGTASKADLLNVFPLTSSSMTRLLDEMTTQQLIVASGLAALQEGGSPSCSRPTRSTVISSGWKSPGSIPPSGCMTCI